jgi:putative two-component system response regulator
MPNVVVVDDEPAVRGLTARWLEAAGYHPRVAADADSAFEEVKNTPPGVVVTDLRMPGHDGLWLAEQVRRACPDTAVVVATGSEDLSSAVSSLRLGVLDYLVKPFSYEQLRAAVQRGMLWHATRSSSRLLTDTLEREAHQRDGGPASAQMAMQLNVEGTVDAMVSMLEMWNRPVADHAQRVAVMSVRLAEMLGVPEGDRADLHRAALLHEVAAVGTPERQAPEVDALAAGEELPADQAAAVAPGWFHGVAMIAGASAIIESIDEWFDGSGVPSGRHTADIPIGSRILAVANVFDELRHPRGEGQTAARSRSVRGALIELNRGRGRRFDPDCIDALVKLQTVN